MKELTPAEIAEQAIGLFLEYARNGYDEEAATNLAILEVIDGCSVKPEDLGPQE